MFKTPLTRLVVKPIAAAVVMFAAGCASLGAAKPEDAVKQRAEAYWKARVAGQVD